MRVVRNGDRARSPGDTGVLSLARGRASALVFVMALAAGWSAGLRAADWQRWTLIAASRHADAAVFVLGPQRLAVRSGERVGSSPWTLVAIDGDRIWLRAAEEQSQHELLRALRHGEALPEAPTTKDLGLEAVEVPVFDVVTEDGNMP